MTRDYYQLPKSSSVMRFLWKCAGGDRYLLERATYSDQIKYMCLGGIVFATGALAGIAGGYAFYTIFEPRGSAIENPIDTQTVFTAIFFGIIWGLMILNIDRFIVTSTGKGDGTEAITMGELKSALPRILMGMIIAMTISKPVEIRMFKTEIDIKLREKQIEQQTIYIDKVNANFNEEIKNKDKELIKFDKDLGLKIGRHAELEKQYIEEARIITVGPRALAVKEQMDAVGKEISDIKNNPEYSRIKKEKKIIEDRREKALADTEKVANGLDGLLERIKIAHEVAGFWISLFITLLFMAIELTPIFFKLMLTKTTYDYLAENRDELIKAEYGIEVKYDYYKDKQGVEKHLTVNHEAERLIFEKIEVTKIQKELTEYAVQKYKEREMKKIDENLDEYIKTINTDEQSS
ncbi:DUF4407 domain-containing protein [Flavobacterium sinopsychrotolerans]|uniref:DUF4407 domain-containing protein n=1 Tax=Flavobacterium sinopsychrotolerans TaxID=604089 RepID=A0A1H8LXZ8_9FLAO|nr:DUF4407 domain-containing protein [Flavobacterium sinopsychrotolerans]SEO09987.1 protein of unknown function [Flavobacterium sinopsychrotolerans]